MVPLFRLALAWALGQPGVRMLHDSPLTPAGRRPPDSGSGARLCSLILFGLMDLFLELEGQAQKVDKTSTWRFL